MALRLKRDTVTGNEQVPGARPWKQEAEVSWKTVIGGEAIRKLRGEGMDVGPPGIRTRQVHEVIGQ